MAVDRLTQANLTDFYQLYLYAFNKQDSPYRRQFFTTRFKHAQAYGIYQAEQLTSGLLSIPLQVYFHGTSYQMNGIGDVMSAPESRGHGNAGKLLTTALENMYQQQITLSYLAPFAYRYYRRFGYEHTFNHLQYSLAGRDLPKIKSASFQVKRSSLAAALPEIMPYYQQKARSRSGALVRPTWWWDYLTQKHPDWEVARAYNQQKQLIGYLIYSRQATTFTSHECQVSDATGYQTLMQFIRRHQSSYQRFLFVSADDHNLLDLLPEPSLATTQLQPYMMARIVNLKQFIQAYPFTQKQLAPLTLTVTDPILAANNGTWQLQLTEGQVTFAKIDSANVQKARQIQTDIQTLTKLLFGVQTGATLAHYGQLTGTIEALTALDAVLPHTRPQLWDYF